MFSKIIGKRLQTLFSSIPSDVEAAMVEEIRVNWVEAHHLLHSGLQQEGGEQGMDG